ncbi:Gfo/Idh/MocA family oxidoreductase [Arenibacter sp. 6A1]|uniref:putative oxidoreductase C-terminal domain-containing protein n=1 Tax=Arenibacter sp. 6A1 TaxID=2720391 RepID=UPI001444E6E7|nr:putative oxidoreductase C-terminal domain-containing protein [Arenibacter sp. 6A1]NKI25327.1 Gfo/Idh/MocA family oxidoreductase [Arenibacter sp. 6A1]
MRKITAVLLVSLCFACAEGPEKNKKAPKEDSSKVKLMTLDPGHFHAALVQKTMYDQVDSTIYVFAPDGPEVADFLEKIESYNTREEKPTAWKVEKYLGADYLEKMVAQKPGNVMVVAGKNSKKIDYILEAVKAGLNVYADKPLVINPEGYQKLVEAFKIAEEKGVVIYDIMTERFEATTAMQKKFSSLPQVFGELLEGTPEEPAISKESVHHFFKQVSGKPLVRPDWFFDVNEEGEGIVDVTTHLVDLVQWELFPEQVVHPSDIEMLSAKRWPTVLNLEQFTDVTKKSEFPDFLQKDVKENGLNVYCNGEMLYKIKGKYAKVSVIWNYQALEGTGDTHYSIMRGSKSDLIIKQGEAENYKPVLYIRSKNHTDLKQALSKALKKEVAEVFPGTTAEQIGENTWKINIPEAYKIGHEAHFAQVTENYLRYLEAGELPSWEVPNMLTKYYTTIEGYKMAKAEGSK